MDIERRVVEEANYMLLTGKTIREVAKAFGVSKSTVHKDLKERLFKLDNSLFLQVQDVLQYHIKIRHIKGGESTRKKYLNLVN